MLYGVYPGRGGEYDSHRDCYVITGKDLNRTKIIDFVITGEDVAGAIHLARALIGGAYERNPLRSADSVAPIQPH